MDPRSLTNFSSDCRLVRSLSIISRRPWRSLPRGRMVEWDSLTSSSLTLHWLAVTELLLKLPTLKCISAFCFVYKEALVHLRQYEANQTSYYSAASFSSFIRHQSYLSMTLSNTSFEAHEVSVFWLSFSLRENLKRWEARETLISRNLIAQDANFGNQ